MSVSLEQLGEKHFAQRARLALQNQQLRQNLRGATDWLRTNRKEAFDDADALEALRDLGSGIRKRALSRLPELLETLEQNCSNNGIQVHWAEDAEQANQLIYEVLTEHNVKTVVKGKSMVTEEIELNHYLDARGIECIESDMGEYIIQLAEETPSHIIVPAVHKNKKEIAELFHEKIEGVEYTEDVDTLIGIGRRILREKYVTAGAGVSGVNFAVAETGTLCLVENEGNGRMCTTAPDLHIAVTGIEKVVEKLTDVAPLLSLLTRSATGQAISTYFNMISSPRRDGEKDGPKEVHLVLVDNGRSSIYRNPIMQPTLNCIRCGACMNHCPVYALIGGHAYGSTYPGPIGQIVTPQLNGLEKSGELLKACSLNGACGEVCPVRIPIPKIIRALRHEAVSKEADSDTSPAVRGRGSQRYWLEALIWKGWQVGHQYPFLYRLGSRVATRLRGLMPKHIGAWTSMRSAPRLADKTLHELVKNRQAQNGGS